MTITLREANVVADALSEYLTNHTELHPLYKFRLEQLTQEIRNSYTLGKQREAEKEAQRWGKH